MQVESGFTEDIERGMIKETIVEKGNKIFEKLFPVPIASKEEQIISSFNKAADDIQHENNRKNSWTVL